MWILNKNTGLKFFIQDKEHQERLLADTANYEKIEMNKGDNVEPEHEIKPISKNWNKKGK